MAVILWVISRFANDYFKTTFLGNLLHFPGLAWPSERSSPFSIDLPLSCTTGGKPVDGRSTTRHPNLESWLGDAACKDPQTARCSGQTSGRRKAFDALGAVLVLRPGYRAAFRTTSAARLCAILSVQASLGLWL